MDRINNELLLTCKYAVCFYVKYNKLNYSYRYFIFLKLYLSRILKDIAVLAILSSLAGIHKINTNKKINLIKNSNKIRNFLKWF